MKQNITEQEKTQNEQGAPLQAIALLGTLVLAIILVALKFLGIL